MRQFLLALCIIMAPNVFSQGLLDREISVKFKDENLEKCLVHIENVSGISFSYNSRQVDAVGRVYTKSFEQTSLANILDFLLAETRMKYKEIGDQITVYQLSSDHEEVIISGYIRDKRSGEELIGARILFPQHGIGCISNSYGYYAIEVPRGLTEFKVSSLGMLTIQDQILVEQEMVMNIGLELDTVVLNTVEVISDSVSNSFQQLNVADLSTLEKTTITPLAISRVPAASGEKDLLRHIQQLPGVQPANSGGANFMVRGSTTGGNLVLMDEIPIYHPTHLLGLYSIINTDALRTAALYKDYIPLQYGTRSASVLQIHTKEGDLNNYHVSGGISGFMGRLNLEGPIIKKKASFYLSSRASTFPGALSNVFNDRQLQFPRFQDVSGKMNFHVNSNNRIYFTGYYGVDRLNDTINEYRWGNHAFSFRWNRILSTKTFSNLSVVHSEFQYGLFGLSTFYGTEDIGQKVVTDKINYDFTHYYNNTTKINYGVSAGFIRTSKGPSGKNAKLFLNRQALENGIYGSIEKSFSRRLSVKAGVRVPFSFHIGTGDTTSYLNKDYSQTFVVYQKNKLYDPIFFIDPRLVASYRLDEKNEVQFAAMVTSQNTHIVNYVNNFLPIEIWTPSTGYLKPQRNFQTSLGIVHSYKNLDASAVVYGKYVNNVLDYAHPTFTASTDIESNLLPGSLKVFGVELMANYRFTTWYSASISYAYTKTSQQIDGINNDKPYVAPGDRPHYYSFSQYFNWSKKWQITTNYTRHTGTAITLPNGQFVIDGTAFPLYSSERNTERLPTFKRLDLSFKRQLGVKKNKNHWDLTFTVTNVFGRNNPSIAYVDHENDAPDQLVIRTFDYSPFMISMSLNFKY